MILFFFSKRIFSGHSSLSKSRTSSLKAKSHNDVFENNNGALRHGDEYPSLWQEFVPGLPVALPLRWMSTTYPLPIRRYHRVNENVPQTKNFNGPTRHVFHAGSAKQDVIWASTPLHHVRVVGGSTESVSSVSRGTPNQSSPRRTTMMVARAPSVASLTSTTLSKQPMAELESALLVKLNLHCRHGLSHPKQVWQNRSFAPSYPAVTMH
jgi:hypothetical protein